MACAELLQTQAFIDGQLSGPGAEAAERHVAGCRECQAFCEDAAALSEELHSHAQRHAAPERLRLRVLEAIADADRAEPAAPMRSGRISGVLHAVGSRLFVSGFAGGLAASGLAAAILVLAAPPLGPATLADRIVRAHTEALMSGRTIQVVSSDRHTVKPWFAGKIDLSPPVHDFAAQGFRLTGGRLDKLGGAPAAVVVYQHGKHAIDLFVWADRRQALPGNATRRGYNTLSWKRGDLDYAAVSDMQASELSAFAGLVRSAGE